MTEHKSYQLFNQSLYFCDCIDKKTKIQILKSQKLTQIIRQKTKKHNIEIFNIYQVAQIFSVWGYSVEIL